jgi:hypothetical protein
VDSQDFPVKADFLGKDLEAVAVHLLVLPLDPHPHSFHNNLLNPEVEHKHSQ